MSYREAGRRLAGLAVDYDFAFFEYWASDYAGHWRDMQGACNLLSGIDTVLGGLLDVWDESEGLLLITSDHGNMEDLSTRTHTTHPVPALVVGVPHLRRTFIAGLRDLSDVAPAILRQLT